MTSRITLLLAAGTIGIAALASSGCSADPVGSSTAALSFRLTPSPAGAGRFGDGQGDTALFNIISIEFMPADPELEALLNGEPYSLRFGVYDVDLTRTEPDLLAEVALQPGTYKVTRFIYRPLRYTDSATNPAAPDCFDRISSFPSGPALVQVPFPFETLEESDGLTFTIAPGQTKVDLLVDVPGLLEAYSAAFTCTDSCGGGPACLSAFDVDAGHVAFASHVSFQ